jgi:hypothetical protein
MGVLMPLQEQIIDVPIVGGLQQQEDSRLTAAPQVLHNCRYNKAGTISKRRGYTPIASVSSDYTQIHVRDEKLTLSCPTSIATYSQYQGIVSSVSDTRMLGYTEVIRAGQNSVTDIDVAAYGNYRVYFWAESLNTTAAGTILCYSVIDITANEVAVPRTVLSDAGNSPQLVLSGTNILFVYSLSTDVKCMTLDMTAPTGALTGPVTVADLVNGGVKNVFPLTTGTKWALCCARTVTGTLYMYIAKMDGTTLETANAFAVGASISTINQIACCWDTTNLNVWVMSTGDDVGTATDRTTVYAVFSSADWSTTVTGLTPISSENYITGAKETRAIIATSSTQAYALRSNPARAACGWDLIDTAGTIVTTYEQGTLWRNHPTLHFVSRPYYSSSLGVVVMGYTKGSGNTLCLVQLSTGNMFTPLVTYQPGVISYYASNETGENWGFSHGNCAALLPVSGGFESAFLSPAASIEANARTIGMRASVETSPFVTWVEYEKSLIFSGGVPLEYDGVSVCELCPIGHPAQIDAVDSATAGSLAAVSYSYKAVPCYLSQNNLLHRGAPSDAGTDTPAANKSMDIYMPSVSTSKRAVETYYELYRTLDSGSTYHRLATDVPGTSLRNDLSVAYIDYHDDVASSTIETNPVLYTTGGILSNVQPPSARLVHRFRDRLWLADTPDGYIWYSKRLLPGEAPSFTLAFTLTPLQKGRVKGISSFEDKLILFYEDSIWGVFGEGPEDTGAGGTFSSQRIMDGVGCTNFKSIVQTPMGIMFQDTSGIHLLSRDLQVSRVGMNIEDVLDTYTTCTSAVHVPAEKEVRFTFVTSTTSRIIVFDYESGAWSTDEPNDGFTTSPILDACMYQNKYTYLKSTRVIQESATSYKDNSNWVTMTFETGEIHVNQIQGMQRVWEAYALTKRHSAHGLTLTFYNDYSSNSSQSETFTEAVVTTAGTVGQFGVTLVEQECQSLRIRVSDSTASGTGQGCTITGITLCVGSEGKITKRVHTDQRK